MKKLVIVNACVRQADSRTLRIAEPIIEVLTKRYETLRYNLPEMEGIVPITPELFDERGRGEIPAWALEAAKAIAAADRIMIVAPFWDMSFPAALKCFFEQTSLFEVTFTDNVRHENRVKMPENALRNPFRADWLNVKLPFGQEALDEFRRRNPKRVH